MTTRPGPTGLVKVLQIHPTRRCNLRCRHCYSRSGPDVSETLDEALLRHAIDDAAMLGYGVMSVSGGEPLLDRRLDALLGCARDAAMRTTVTTNGMALTPRRVERLAGLVDLIAISLDGTPASHNRMRGNDRAFESMAERVPVLQAAGVPFGFIFTLTQFNADELSWVVDFAISSGAGLVQVHPLEPEGNAIEQLADALPDQVELACAAIEAARLRRGSAIEIQVDAVQRSDLIDRPEQFLALEAVPAGPIGSWLSPLVIETDGTVVPLAYGMARRLALGNLYEQSLPAMASAWAERGAPEFLSVCRAVRDNAVNQPDATMMMSWYDRVCTAGRASVSVVPSVTEGRRGYRGEPDATEKRLVASKWASPTRSVSS